MEAEGQEGKRGRERRKKGEGRTVRMDKKRKQGKYEEVESRGLPSMEKNGRQKECETKGINIQMEETVGCLELRGWRRFFMP